MDTPLSEEAVREAYFLGQRHDQSLAELLNKYSKSLPPPETGPYISSITFYTPYALAVFDSSLHNFNYHAQDAEQDHLNQTEVVRVVVQVWLTDSYGPNIMSPTNSSDAAPIGIGFRSTEFWKDFRVHVYNGAGKRQERAFPEDAGGQPTYWCSEGGCVLNGAIIHFDFPAQAFTADCASVRVDPPEGDAVSVDFNLSALR